VGFVGYWARLSVFSFFLSGICIVHVFFLQGLIYFFLFLDLDALSVEFLVLEVFGLPFLLAWIRILWCIYSTKYFKLAANEQRL
jgi:hypothetical protein